MKTIFTITPENLELFQSAVDFTSFLETMIILPTCFDYDFDEYKAIFNEEAHANFLRTDYYDLYQKLTKAIDIFSIKGTFSKANSKLIYDRLYIDSEYIRGEKLSIQNVVKKTKDRLDAKKIGLSQYAGGKGCGPVMQKVVEKQSGFSRYIETIKEKKHILFACGAFLAVVWTMFFFKHH